MTRRYCVSDDKNPENNEELPAGEKPASTPHFPEMDELQNEIARRIRDNQKFLDHFMDTDYVEEDDEDDEEDDDLFEEL